MKKAKAELLLQEIAAWRQEQCIDAATAERLAQRYRQPGSAVAVLLRWLGLGSVLLLGMALFAAVKLLLDAALLSTLLVAAFAVGMIYLGVRMSSHAEQSYPVTGAAITTLGLLAVFAAAVLFAGEDAMYSVRFGLLLAALISLAIAYRFALRWPLLLALLAIFHGVGSRSAYAGSGEYFADIANPPLMALLGFATAAFGSWHLHAEDGRLARYAGFGRLYLILGLLYGNVSLWFQSIGDLGDYQAAWVAVFSVACLVEIGLGARLKDGRFTGFGIVFLGIDLYTRFYENAWDRLDSGSFFLLCGLAGLLLGLGFEWRGRRMKAVVGTVMP